MASVFEARLLPRPAAPRSAARAGAIATCVLHALALAALFSYAPARQAITAAAPIMVELITSRREERIEPIPPAKPRPAEAKPLAVDISRQAAPETLPIVTEAPSAAAPMVTAPPPAPPPQPIASLAPPSVTPPLFNAAYLNNPAAPYPRLSQRLGEEGTVTLRVLVSAAGRAAQVQLRKSSGFAALDDSALETVRNFWKFVPARSGSEIVEAWVVFDIPFILNKRQ